MCTAHQPGHVVGSLKASKHPGDKALRGDWPIKSTGQPSSESNLEVGNLDLTAFQSMNRVHRELGGCRFTQPVTQHRTHDRQVNTVTGRELGHRVSDTAGEDSAPVNDEAT